MSILEEEISDATVRSHRRTQMPRYLENYEVDYVSEQQLVHTPSGHSNEGEQLVGASGGPFAIGNPLVASIDHFPASKGIPHFSPEVLQRRLQDLEEENSRLRHDLREHSAAHSPRPLSPFQSIHSPRHSMRNMEEQASTSTSYHRVTSTRDQRDPCYEKDKSVNFNEDKLCAERQRDRIDEIILELQRMKVNFKTSRSASPPPKHAATLQRAEHADEHYNSPTSRQQQPYVPYRSSLPHSQENIYRGPTPTIPDFTREDPREFARFSENMQ